MAYQLRHKREGLYQGNFLGLGFWHPLSEQPEQGICKFETEEEVNQFIAFLCGPECKTQYARCEFTVEPFDQILNDELTKDMK